VNPRLAVGQYLLSNNGSCAKSILIIALKQLQAEALALIKMYSALRFALQGLYKLCPHTSSFVIAQNSWLLYLCALLLAAILLNGQKLQHVGSYQYKACNSI